jgi:NAD-dependent SIR2 family protein deacetylase
MSDSNNGRFRCIHCGDRFDLNDEDMELFNEGFFALEPDTCDDCGNYESAPDYPEFSDADPGL